MANDTYQKTTKILNDESQNITTSKELNKILNILKENIGIWAETVAPENVKNLANDIEPEKEEISPS